MIPPLYVSYFTTTYADEAAGLVASLERFNLPHDVRPVPCLGTWVRNCGHKPAFLLEMMAAHPGCPVVWTDADSRIVAVPVLFDTLDCDVACHYRAGTELLSGTLYFGPTTGARDLLERWRAGCEASPHEWDQKVLAGLLDGSRTWRVQHLPASYCQIWDNEEMGDPREAVVIHRQASRELRRQLDRDTASIERA